MELILFVLLVAVAAWFVTGPLRAGDGEDTVDRRAERRAELEARKEAKYREIRDAQLDHAGGKIEPAEFDALDAELRAEAMAILHELDRLEPPQPAGRGDIGDGRRAGDDLD